MTYAWCCKNGEMLPHSDAAIPLANIEYAYGFGVYESIRTVGGKPVFLLDHLSRLLRSAEVIGLHHELTTETLQRWVIALITENNIDACNLKILLIGAKEPKNVLCWIIPLSPLFPEKKLFARGANVITAEYERFLPQAKTLNMLPSYLLYSKARAAGCYDTLLIDRTGCITEGTRTNVLALRGTTLVSPPSTHILEGVTRAHVIDTAKKNGFSYAEEPISLSNIRDFDGFFLTSTSSKIMPLAQIDTVSLAIPDTLRTLMKAFDEVLASH